jgi:multiple sugar transport system ATP-binding protein
MANVSVSNLTHRHGTADAPALRDVSFEVADHELMVIAGPAGSGKSTLLRAIAGLEDAIGGEITIGGKRVNALPPHLRDIAMVFTHDTLYPQLSVAENIALGLKLRKFSQKEITRRVQDSAAILGLDKVVTQKPAALSGADRQRVAIARAVARQPKVFLFDDPFASFEPDEHAQLRADLIRLHQRVEATMIFATRDQADAMSLGQRTAVMEGGVVQQIGETLELYREPANKFVASFLGRPQMNFIAGTLKQDRDGLLFTESGDGTVQARLTSLKHERTGELIGKPLLLGVRPEEIDIVTRGEGSSKIDAFPAVVEIVERIGAETNLHLNTGVQRLVCTCRSALDDGGVGRRAYFRINTGTVHLFDPPSMRRIC